MDEFPFSALFLFAQSCLTDAVNVIFSDYCFTDTYLKESGGFSMTGKLLAKSVRFVFDRWISVCISRIFGEKGEKMRCFANNLFALLTIFVFRGIVVSLSETVQ